MIKVKDKLIESQFYGCKNIINIGDIIPESQLKKYFKTSGVNYEEKIEEKA